MQQMTSSDLSVLIVAIGMGWNSERFDGLNLVLRMTGQHSLQRR
jgi:hypothetical protein